MARRPYVASGKSSPGGPLLLLGYCLAAGLVVGFVEGFVSKWLSLLLLFPAVVGLVVGATATRAIDGKKIRAPLLALAFAALGALVGEATVHGMKYVSARSAVAEAIENDPTAAEYLRTNGTGPAVDAVFAGDEGDLPVVGYLKLAARNGVTITRAASSSSSSPTLTGVGVYALWFVNLAIAMGIAAAMAFNHARRPFCEGCEDWYGRTETLATGAGDSSKQVRRHFEAGQLTEGMSALGTSDGKAAAVVQLQGCHSCAVHEPVLELHLITGLKSDKQANKRVFASLVTATEAQALRQAAQAKGPA